MSNLQSLVLTIPAGNDRAKARINLSGGRAITSIATNNTVTSDVNSKRTLTVRTYFPKLDLWLPVRGAEIEIETGIAIPFDPFSDLLGEEEVEFQLSAVQTSDVTFEIKFTSI